MLRGLRLLRLFLAPTSRSSTVVRVASFFFFFSFFRSFSAEIGCGQVLGPADTDASPAADPAADAEARLAAALERVSAKLRDSGLLDDFGMPRHLASRRAAGLLDGKAATQTVAQVRDAAARAQAEMDKILGEAQCDLPTYRALVEADEANRAKMQATKEQLTKTVADAEAVAKASAPPAPAPAPAPPPQMDPAQRAKLQGQIAQLQKDIDMQRHIRDELVAAGQALEHQLSGGTAPAPAARPGQARGPPPVRPPSVRH
eukprot:TRINITY_DN2864_c0_g1_i1.p1 TRINITY_DN2864_c0_g1~~TRINITY_DN2864_c0_g1_i1.p1  ORF type:complete len:259 (-),score=66.53 TRINITY_DN2864_c0_g1_i1:55-831(-)